MPNFTAPLNFLDLTENTPPTGTDLLFYNQPDNQLSRGWYQDGQLVLIGSNFQPTHFAEYLQVVEQQSGRQRTFGVINDSLNDGKYYELESTGHREAATLYRQHHRLTGYAKLTTVDTEVILGRRQGEGRLTHDTRSFIQPTIMYRNTFIDGDGWTYYPMLITIAAECPICRQPRGPLMPGSVCEDGEWFHVNQWHNACGHQDSFQDAYLEYRQLKKDGLLDEDGQPIQGEILQQPVA